MQGLLLFLVFAVSQFNAGNFDKALIKDYIAAEATLVGAPVAEVLHIAEAESGFNSNAVGDKGTSFGLFQIHLPAHHDISKEQANNIVFSTEWSIQQIKAGRGEMWSTYDQSLDTPQNTLKSPYTASSTQENITSAPLTGD